MKQEFFARAFLIVLFLTAVVFVAAKSAPDGSIMLTGSMPEDGGWQPGVINAQVGELLSLRLTSLDVMHGFAIGHMDSPHVDVYPGQVTEIELTFDEPGTYTYYCTRWCGPNHWRMRGTIEVEGDEDLPDSEAAQPMYQLLGIDIDAPHPAEFLPNARPDAAQGERSMQDLPLTFLASSYYLAHSPSDFFEDLQSEPSLIDLPHSQLWDVVAYVYWQNTTPELFREGQDLYAENCAACHGASGAGDGVFAGAAEQTTPVTDFTDAGQMLGASPALLQGKIIRGGMGTGMPYWGTIFTEEQTWALVSYLWSFQFEFPTGD